MASAWGLGEGREAILRLREQCLRQALFAMKKPELETALNFSVATDTETEGRFVSDWSGSSPVESSVSSALPSCSIALAFGSGRGLGARSSQRLGDWSACTDSASAGVVGRGWVYFTNVRTPWCLGTGPAGHLPVCVRGGPPAFPGLFLFRLQGAAPEDFSNLPPEQRRKKLQQKVDELNKEIQKEMDQR